MHFVHRRPLMLALFIVLLCSYAPLAFAAPPADPYGDAAVGYGVATVVANAAAATGAPDGSLATLIGVGGGLEIDLGAQELGSGPLRLTYGGLTLGALTTVQFRNASNQLISSAQVSLLVVGSGTSSVVVPYSNATGYRYVRVVGLTTSIGIDAVEDLGFATADYDGDGLPNGWEREYGLDLLSASGNDGANGDVDNDGLTNAQEFARNTNPRNADSDGDGLSDGAEVNVHKTNPLVSDSDSDGLPDSWEVQYSLDPRSATGDDGASGDPDKDGYTNQQEYLANTNPRVAESDGDGDGLPTAWETANGLNPADGQDAAQDTDNDGLTNAQEFGRGTNPRNADSDGDGLSDGAEVNVYKTNPLASDSDGDGLSDGAEVNVHKTNPLASDSDGDGLPDSWEVQYNLDPGSATGDDGASGDPDKDGYTNQQEYLANTNPRVAESDGDGDGLPTAWETANGLNPADGQDAAQDTDNDGLTNAQEFGRGTNPRNADSDGDGLSDGAEVNVYKTNPLVSDSDGDGLPDNWEVQYSLDPRSATGDDGASGDPDKDGLDNAEEYARGTDPRTPDGVQDPKARVGQYFLPLVAR